MMRVQAESEVKLVQPDDQRHRAGEALEHSRRHVEDIPVEAEHSEEREEETRHQRKVRDDVLAPLHRVRRNHAAESTRATNDVVVTRPEHRHDETGPERRLNPDHGFTFDATAIEADSGSEMSATV